MREKKRFLTVQDMVLIAIFTALIAVCAWISIPMGTVPFTLQTFAVFTAAGLLGTKRGIISIFIYILLGFVGVPVFAGFHAGPAVLAGPTGGYLVGFIFTVLIIGMITQIIQNQKMVWRMIITIISMILGDAVCFFVGTIWFMAVMKANAVTALTLCVFPYIIPDLVKILLAAIIVERLKKQIRFFKEI